MARKPWSGDQTFVGLLAVLAGLGALVGLYGLGLNLAHGPNWCYVSGRVDFSWCHYSCALYTGAVRLGWATALVLTALTLAGIFQLLRRIPVAYGAWEDWRATREMARMTRKRQMAERPMRVTWNVFDEALYSGDAGAVKVRIVQVSANPGSQPMYQVRRPEGTDGHAIWVSGATLRKCPPDGPAPGPHRWMEDGGGPCQEKP